MTFEIAVIITVAIAGAVGGLVKRALWYRKMLADPPGWLWFTADPKNLEAARVGLTDADPDNFIPAGIILLHKQPVANQREAVIDIAANLKRARIRGNWYEIGTVQAYIDRLKARAL